MSYPQIWSRVLVHLCGAKSSPVEMLAWVLATKCLHVHGAGPDLPGPFLGTSHLSSQYLREAKHHDTQVHVWVTQVPRLKESIEMRYINISVKQVLRDLIKSIWKGCT